jgi:hypothetical protein
VASAHSYICPFQKHNRMQVHNLISRIVAFLHFV